MSCCTTTRSASTTIRTCTTGRPCSWRRISHSIQTFFQLNHPRLLTTVSSAECPCCCHLSYHQTQIRARRPVSVQGANAAMSAMWRRIRNRLFGVDPIRVVEERGSKGMSEADPRHARDTRARSCVVFKTSRDRFPSTPSRSTVSRSKKTYSCRRRKRQRLYKSSADTIYCAI